MGEVITIDGLVASGKSTLGRIFAERIGYQFIDSGLIYRAGTYYLLSRSLPLDGESNASLFTQMNIQFIPGTSREQVFAFGEDVSDWLHTPQVSSAVPKVAKVAAVRKEVRDIQRRIAEKGNFVFAGRDIGTIVFPKSRLKFVVTATIKKRAERRYYQLKKSDPDVVFEDVLADLKMRDYQDIHRKAAPFKKSKDAIVIDTTELTIEEAVTKMEQFFEEIILKPNATVLTD